MRTVVRAIAICLTIAAGTAFAGQQCFTAFGGTVTYAFNAKVTSKKALSGRIFGSLASCAGLTAWPIVGSAFTNASKTQITLAFRAMTVDAAACGAVDHIVTLSLPGLTGNLELHNDRNSVSNTSAITVADCPAAIPPAVVPRSVGGADVFGNVAGAP